MKLENGNRSANRIRKLRASSLVVIFGMLLLSFQNCGGSFDSTSTSAQNSAASVPGLTTSGSTGGATAGTTGGSTGGSNAAELEAARVARCKTFVGNPSIQVIRTASGSSATSVNVPLDVGASASAGDSTNGTATNITIDVTRGITDEAQAIANACGIQTKVDCTIDTSKLVQVTNGFNTSGVNVGLGAAAADQLTIADGTISRNMCSQDFPLTYSTVSKSFKFTPIRTGTTGFSCVTGEATIKIVLQNQSSDGSKKSAISAPVYVKVTMNDKCWDESRLKVGTDLASAYPKDAKAGWAVSTDGVWTAVVASEEGIITPSVPKAGAVYMFQRVGANWLFKQKIQLNTAVTKDTINAVALKGSRMVFASQNRNSYQGSVFVYALSGTTWSQMQEITPPAATGRQYFGASLAMNDSTLAVGAPGYSEGDAASTVYIYDCSGASCNAIPRLSNMVAAKGSGLGLSLSLDGTTLAAGAPGTVFTSAYTAGFVNIYSTVNGALLKTIKSNDADSTAIGYGSSVAILGNKLVVGAPGRSATATKTNAGAIYYYADYSVVAADAPTRFISGDDKDGKFGMAVAMHTDGLLAGCPSCLRGADTSGFVNFYKFTTLASAATVDFQLFGLNPSVTATFGNSISVSGSTLAVGAFGKGDPLDNSGAAYTFDKRP